MGLSAWPVLRTGLNDHQHDAHGQHHGVVVVRQVHIAQGGAGVDKSDAQHLFLSDGYGNDNKIILIDAKCFRGRDISRNCKERFADLTISQAVILEPFNYCLGIHGGL